MRRWNKGRRVERERFDHGAPIAKIDTRPMVFVVMFVALVFLLLAAKPKLHAIEIGLPPPVPPPDAAYVSVPHITVEVFEDGQIIVNGRLVDFDSLAPAIAATNMEDPVVLARFDAMADYKTVLQVIGKLQEAGISSWDICLDGLEEHRYFDRISSTNLNACSILVGDYRSNPFT
ncbi:MAG: biopolymer transporter ExbD [Erythrobacter sp.]